MASVAQRRRAANNKALARSRAMSVMIGRTCVLPKYLPPEVAEHAGRAFADVNKEADPHQLAALRLWGWCRAPVDDASAVEYFFEWRERRREQLRELRPLISSIRAWAAAAQAAQAAEQQQLDAAKGWLYDSFLASLDSPCTCSPYALTPNTTVAS